MEDVTSKLVVEKTVDDKIELIKSISEVQSTIRAAISSDFVLSRLNDKEKQFVIEMSNNAFLSRRILETLQRDGKVWEWNTQEKKWIYRSFNEKELIRTTKLIEKCFDAYMNRIYMIVLLNRNVPKNYIVEKITGVLDEQEDPDSNMNSLLSKVKNKLGIPNEN